MSELEIVIRSAIYTIAFLLVIAGSIHYGWSLRESLAHKVEYFGISQKRWRDYDVKLKAGDLPARAELHDINERRERQSDK